MDLMSLIALALLHLAAVASPGPDFALTTRNSIVHGRVAGLYTSVGISAGALIHMAFVMAGLSIILTDFPIILKIIQYAGAAYLVYIGIKSILNAKAGAFKINDKEQPKNPERTHQSFALEGFMTSVLNPKSWVYFSAVFSQFITVDTSTLTLAIYAAIILFIQTSWFSGLSLFLTVEAIRNCFISISHWVDRICGGLLALLGLKLALSKI